jgi:hypothetical protein
MTFSQWGPGLEWVGVGPLGAVQPAGGRRRREAVLGVGLQGQCLRQALVGRAMDLRELVARFSFFRFFIFFIFIWVEINLRKKIKFDSKKLLLFFMKKRWKTCSPVFNEDASWRRVSVTDWKVARGIRWRMEPSRANRRRVSGRLRFLWTNLNNLLNWSHFRFLLLYFSYFFVINSKLIEFWSIFSEYLK